MVRSSSLDTQGKSGNIIQVDDQFVLDLKSAFFRKRTEFRFLRFERETVRYVEIFSIRVHQLPFEVENWSFDIRRERLWTVDALKYYPLYYKTMGNRFCLILFG